VRSTINGCLRMLELFYSWCVQCGLLVTGAVLLVRSSSTARERVACSPISTAFLALAAIPFRTFLNAADGNSRPSLCRRRSSRRGLGSGASPQKLARDARPIGQPHKPAWPRIVELVRQLHQQHPDWQKKHLAFEAWRRATDEFSESELPSVSTVQRIAEILNDGSVSSSEVALTA
jgi:hypothetical protein